MRKQGITKRFPVFLRLFFAFLKTAGTMLCKGDRKKFPKISAYSGLCGVVRNREIFLQINVHFAFFSFVGIRGRNISAALAKFFLAALKVSREFFAGMQ